MTTLLHISASPRGEASESGRIAEVFLEAYRETHPGDAVDHWDLWAEPLPDFAAGARAKMTVFAGGEPAGEEAEAWAAARRAFDRFDAADRLLFGVPMWNGGIPYVLKHLIDAITQPGWLFGVDPVTGYQHLLAGRGKRAAAIHTSAVWGPGLGPEFGSDFSSTYLEDWLRFAGIDDITDIRFHPTLTGDWDATRQQTYARARDIGKLF